MDNTIKEDEEILYQKILTTGILIICTCTDIYSKKIYKNVLGLYLLLSLTGRCVEYLSGQNIDIIKLAAGVVPGCVCLLLSFFTRQGIGYGDSLLIVLCGLAVGKNACWGLLFTAFFLAGILGIIMWLLFHVDRKREIPFVPFMMLGWIVQILAETW